MTRVFLHPCATEMIIYKPTILHDCIRELILNQSHCISHEFSLSYFCSACMVRGLKSLIKWQSWIQRAKFIICLFANQILFVGDLDVINLI